VPGCRPAWVPLVRVIGKVDPSDNNIYTFWKAFSRLVEVTEQIRLEVLFDI
jgi:hypothetical protein